MSGRIPIPSSGIAISSLRGALRTSRVHGESGALKNTVRDWSEAGTSNADINHALQQYNQFGGEAFASNRIDRSSPTAMGQDFLNSVNDRYLNYGNAREAMPPLPKNTLKGDIAKKRANSKKAGPKGGMR